jgi:hypothetical protein
MEDAERVPKYIQRMSCAGILSKVSLRLGHTIMGARIYTQQLLFFCTAFKPASTALNVVSVKFN